MKVILFITISVLKLASNKNTTDSLVLLSFNTWRCGASLFASSHEGLDSVVEQIKLADADIIGLQEMRSNQIN